MTTTVKVEAHCDSDTKEVLIQETNQLDRIIQDGETYESVVYVDVVEQLQIELSDAKKEIAELHKKHELANRNYIAACSEVKTEKLLAENLYRQIAALKAGSGLDNETEIALKEAWRNDFIERYFENRRAILNQSRENEKLFSNGFDRGWQSAMECIKKPITPPRGEQ